MLSTLIPVMVPIVSAYMAVKFATGDTTVLMEAADKVAKRKWYAYHVVAFVSIGLLMCSHPLNSQEMYWSEDHGIQH